MINRPFHAVAISLLLLAACAPVRPPAGVPSDATSEEVPPVSASSSGARQRVESPSAPPSPPPASASTEHLSENAQNTAAAHVPDAHAPKIPKSQAKAAPTVAPTPQSRGASTPGDRPAPAALASLDLASLKQRLRDTHAIGVFTKLSLKNQVDDLVDAVRAFHTGKSKDSLVDLRQRYDILFAKVLELLHDADPSLAAVISASREPLWSILADRDKFQKLQLS